MNKHILLVMKWLKDKDSVSLDELEKNKNEAHAATDTNLVGVWAAAYAAASTYHVYNAAAAADYDYVSQTVYWLGKYFETTGEDKEEYLKELEK